MSRFLRTFLFLLLTLPSLAFAHESGKSFDLAVDGYLIDINYSPAPITAGEQTYFDFKIFKQNPPMDVQYDGIWVRITRDKSTLLATDIRHTALGSTGIQYTFETPGSYTIETKYEKGDDVIATASFPIEVLPNPHSAQTTDSPLWRVATVVLLGLIFIIGTLYLRRKVSKGQ